MLNIPISSYSTLFMSIYWMLQTLYSVDTSSNFRANVTLKLGLSTDFNTECDDTVYKVVVCAGEFTNRCQLVGPISRFIQATCAFQGPPESISFLVSSVGSPIELQVTVQKVGEQDIQQLRNTEFRLTEENELSVTSYDLSLMVRFYVTYSCLPNYFGKLCTKYCNIEATEYRCDHLGNMLCQPGYYMDQKFQICRLDQCANHKHYCFNNGVCMNNPNIDAMNSALCICPSNYKGLRCELENYMVTSKTSLESINKLSLENNKLTNRNNSIYYKSLLNNTTTTTITTATTTTSTTATTIDDEHSKFNEYDKNQHMKYIHFKDDSVDPIQVKPVTQQLIKPITINTTISPTESTIEMVVLMKNAKVFTEQNWRKVIILSSIGLILIITISTGCIGLVLCIMRRKPKKSNITRIITPDSNCNYKSTRQWMPIDQPPTGFNYYDNSDYRIFPGNTNNSIIETDAAYPTSLSETQLQTNTNIDGNYGMYDVSSPHAYYINHYKQHRQQFHEQQLQQSLQQQQYQTFRHSSIGTTGCHNELLNENSFTSIPKNVYLPNRYMTWNSTNKKQPPCYLTSVKQLSLDNRDHGENYEEGYHHQGQSMINLNSYHSNNSHNTNENSRFPINLDNPSIINNKNDMHNNDNTTSYLQTSCNPFSLSLHDSYITDGYFDQLPNISDDYTNNNNNYVIHDDNNHYLSYKAVQDTINMTSNNYNRNHMNSSTLPPTVSLTSSLTSKVPNVVESLPPPPLPPLSLPPSQFSNCCHY
ncbi:Protein lag-2 [Schistosoma japonicum]|uniref:Protein lag-2 n=1 Tax=Schistosoma japonicum TaxID=6182 RepID=A0A4Z2D376_SCHJA|nr:Protein lag-2 [Schistosoma japonicum]